MEKLLAKAGTFGAYLLTLFSKDDIATFFAIILSIVMIAYYILKAYHERLLIEKEKRERDANSLPK